MPRHATPCHAMPGISCELWLAEGMCLVGPYATSWLDWSPSACLEGKGENQGEVGP